ncbi:hypothetical protein [Bacillus sp. FSL K6-3431]|uniref:hypothetical protein n=1 Tax=Bacillus sp. FSL K6-3431 TaxID=2921500 RepID=UPI0030FAAE5E
MKILYYIVVHVINFFFLVVVGFVSLAFFSNPSAGSLSPLSPAILAPVIFLLLLLVANYIYQLRKKNWQALLNGNVIYIVVLYVVITVVMPFLNALVLYGVQPTF